MCVWRTEARQGRSPGSTGGERPLKYELRTQLTRGLWLTQTELAGRSSLHTRVPPGCWSPPPARRSQQCRRATRHQEARKHCCGGLAQGGARVCKLLRPVSSVCVSHSPLVSCVRSSYLNGRSPPVLPGDLPCLASVRHTHTLHWAPRTARRALPASHVRRVTELRADHCTCFLQTCGIKSEGWQGILLASSKACMRHAAQQETGPYGRQPPVRTHGCMLRQPAPHSCRQPWELNYARMCTRTQDPPIPSPPLRRLRHRCVCGCRPR